VVSDGESLRSWTHPDGGRSKWFCGTCGSHLFSGSPQEGDTILVRMSAFDRAPHVEMQIRAFVADAAPWEPIPDDGIPRFDSMPPGVL
jgi:hypothetical protein